MTTDSTLAHHFTDEPRPGAVAFVGHATDVGEEVAGAHLAAAEVRARLKRLPVDPTRPPRAIFDLGDAAHPAGRLPYPSVRVGTRTTLAADATALSHDIDGLVVLQISARPAQLDLADGTSHVAVGARDLAPEDDLLTLDEWLDSDVSLAELIARRVPTPRPRAAFVAIHLDAFTLPGVAEPSALGFTANAFRPVLRTWLKRFEVRALGLYGLIPPVDSRGVTADFAARLAHSFLHV